MKKATAKLLRHIHRQGVLLQCGGMEFPGFAVAWCVCEELRLRKCAGWDAFEPALTRAEGMAVNEIWEIARSIPPEWYAFDTDGLHRLVETLYHRRSTIRDLITEFRSSSRNPFPLWTSE